LQATTQSPAAVGAVRDYLLRDLETKALPESYSIDGLTVLYLRPDEIAAFEAARASRD
jgi:hypothetical protein